jgi:hypothetical protein
MSLQAVSVSERPGRGTEVIWQATPAGAAHLEQQRRHPRAELHFPLTIATRGEPALETAEAMITDLSEDSLRAAVYGREWSELAPGTSLRVGFTVDNRYFDVDGSVLRTRASDREDDDGVEIIVILAADEETTGSLRDAVFAERQSS